MTPIRINERVVGHVEGLVFKKRIQTTKHMLRVPPSIAFDIDTLEAATKAGADRVVAMDEKGVRYCAMIQLIQTKGIAIDRGHGKQIALGLPHWKPNIDEAQKHADRCKVKPTEQEQEKEKQLGLI